ncbi:MAG TPA: DUF2231 domain-containing protein [Tepidisphaeraceae bacterium]|nr:DUF2231 domain-containing protein [Tepidisphaeraceae bacterium]
MKRILQGKPLGQPLHTLLVHMPIGLLVFSFILDIANLPKTYSSPSVPLATCIFYMMGLGLIGMIIASIPGLVDYTSIRSDSASKNTARIHLWTNAVAFVLFAGSFFMRLTTPTRIGPPLAPFALSMFGVGFLGFAGYLGGQMIYQDGVGVGRHRRSGKAPVRTITPIGRRDDYVVVAKIEDLEDRQTLRVDIDGTIVAVARVDGQYYAFQEFCTHRFGPLSEGCFKDGQVMCPWHRSKFDMRTGNVTQSPAKSSINVYDVQVRDGQILVRAGEQPRRLPAELRPGMPQEQSWKPSEADELRRRNPNFTD